MSQVKPSKRRNGYSGNYQVSKYQNSGANKIGYKGTFKKDGFDSVEKRLKKGIFIFVGAVAILTFGKLIDKNFNILPSDLNQNRMDIQKDSLPDKDRKTSFYMNTESMIPIELLPQSNQQSFDI